MTELDWSALADRAVDAADLKKSLDLVVVCEELGVFLTEDPNTGKFHGICPFHDDTHASFDVYENDKGEQRAGCFACDFGNSNDLYAFIRAIRHCGFREAVDVAREIATRTRAVGPRIRRTVEKQPVDLSPFVEGAVIRTADTRIAIDALFQSRSIDVPIEWAISEFRLGVTPDGGGVVMPHYTKNEDGTLVVVGAKTRRAAVDEQRPWKPMAVAGTRLNTLYGIFRDQGRKHVVLVEGESDTWTAAYYLRGYECEVFGLPAGAAQRPPAEWTQFLQGRDVTLMFDADDGGRTALRNWIAAVGVVRVARLPEGYDVTAAAARNPATIVNALLEAETYGTAMNPGLVEAEFGGYIRANDENGLPMSNFVLRLSRTIETEDEGSLFDVVLPNDQTATLPASELQSDARFRSWCIAHDLVWYGGTKECQELLRMLLMDAVFVPRLRGTSVAGWVGDCFVYPDPIGCIGGSGWAYVPPVADIGIEKSLDLLPGRWEPHVPALLTQLHQLPVITPLLGWIAAAPLRGTMKAFPIMGIVGGAGWGKTTLVREALETFGYRVNSTLTSTTPHGVSSFAAATNAAPVWYDEYRKGAREDARQTFDQVVRDAWESSASYKGGLREQRQALTAIEARAPIIVTGEDAFSETSHLERMAIVHLPRDGRNKEALVKLRQTTRTGFGRAYLEWLTHAYQIGSLPRTPDVPDRPIHVRSVVRWGYGLLDQFCREVLGYELPLFDDSLLVSAHTAAAASPVLLEAIDACMKRHNRYGPIAWREPDGAIGIRLHDLVKEAKDLGITLPGGNRATRTELEQRFDVTEADDPQWGQVLHLREKTT